VAAELLQQPFAEGCGVGTATQQQGAAAEPSDDLDRFWPKNFTAQNVRRSDRLRCGGVSHDLAGCGALGGAQVIENFFIEEIG
jgi:hypothetical protein